MAKLIYSALASLDGYIEDEKGGFDWAEPDQEVHQFANELERPIGTHLLGRRMYETLAFWGSDEAMSHENAIMREFAESWDTAEKIVYSRTPREPTTDRTRIEAAFDPDAVAELKSSAERDISIGGPNLAAQAFEAGLVDECHLLLSPIIVGGGKRALPDGVALELELVDERRFGNGVVYLHYRVRG